jgi:hypothetical protein
LQSAAFQNTVEEELPFRPISSDRIPTSISQSKLKVKEKLPWCPPERLLHRPKNISKPSEPRNLKPKKIRLPVIDYAVIPNCGNVVKVNNNFPFYRIDDDDDDDDER